ncbi:MAG: LysE family translocator [Rhizobiaceae bacterium]|nr:LysE family translocator [Rhizobiaceae bacterium]
MLTTTFLALLVFSFVSSITPGPNNIMLFASGVNFGWWRTFPHAIGISLGFGVLLAAVGLGLGVLLNSTPMLFMGVKLAGGAYMLYLAWKIAHSGPVEAQSGTARPMTLFEAALFQWVNPKAWVMAMVAMSTYTLDGNYLLNVAIVVFVFCVINFPSVTVWAGFGTIMRNFLKDPLKLKIFNYTMAIALVLSLWPMLTA